MAEEGVQLLPSFTRTFTAWILCCCSGRRTPAKLSTAAFQPLDQPTAVRLRWGVSSSLEERTPAVSEVVVVVETSRSVRINRSRGHLFATWLSKS